MKTHIIIATIGDTARFWTGCGWTDSEDTAKRYTEAEAQEVEDRMRKDKVYGTAIRARRKKRNK